MLKLERKGGAGRISLPMILCLIIIFSACLLLIYGLAETLPHLIAVETGQMISEDKYYEKYHDPDWEYYGKYGKCYASLSKEGINTPSSETVGGLKFEYETQSKIRIFYGRRFYSLKAAYENGYLTDDELKDLQFYHTVIIKLRSFLDIVTYTEPVPLYEYEIYSMVYDVYRDNGLLDYETLERDIWHLDCLYKNDTVSCVFMDSTFWYGGAALGYVEIVNGLQFTFPDNARSFSIYSDGNLYSVKSAFEKGILTEETLNEVHQAFILHHKEYVAAGVRDKLFD